MSSRFEPNQYPLDAGVRLLEASAGTGKTFALAHLVLRLVTERKLNLKELLVVTFTEAAAAELRDRIGRRLNDALKALLQDQANDSDAQTNAPPPDAVMEEWLALHGQDPNTRRTIASNLLEALEGLERADITTIHGFCRRSLRRQALQNGTAMEVCLESDSQHLCQEVAYDYWEHQVLALPADNVSGLLHAGLSADQLSHALSRLDSDCAVRIAGTEGAQDQERPLIECFEHWLQSSWTEFEAQWKTNGHGLETAFRDCATDWRSQGQTDTKPYSPKPKKDRASELSDWISELTGTQPSRISYADVRKQSLLGDYFHPGCFSKTARRCSEINPNLPQPTLQKAIATLWDGPAEQVWRHALTQGLHTLAARRAQQGVISFSGLLDALDPDATDAEPQRWLAPIQQRYRVALIDEFQDTDPLQWRLLQACFATPNHLLLMVGDPKQAIYRFRGGDLNTYKQARQTADRIDNLLDNRRTTPTLMEAMNQWMAPGLTLSNLEVPPVTPCASALPLDLPEGEQPLQLIDLQVDDPDHPPTRTALESTIPTLVACHALHLLDSDPSLTPSDLCVLVSRHRQAEAVREQLAQRGLPSRLVSPGDVLSTIGATELQHFLDALTTPADGGRLRRLACSALMQWTSRQLQEAETNGDLDRLAGQLRNLQDVLPSLGLLGCLSQLLEGRMLADLSSRGRLLGDIQQCARLVQDAMHRQGLDLSSAADWLRRQRLQPIEPTPDIRQPHSDLAESAVAVVTVHRSKGLQYPVVICPYLWQAPADRKGPLWRNPPNDPEGTWQVALNPHWGHGYKAAERDQLDSAAEAERLAYVALSRAQRHLVVFWVAAAGQDANPLASWMTELSRLDAPLASLHLPPENTRLHFWRPAPRLETLQLSDVPQRSLDRSWGRSSYSAWISSQNGHHKPAPADPRNLEEGRDIDAVVDTDAVANSEAPGSQLDSADQNGPLAEFPKGPGAGDCLHRILEQVSFQGPADQAPNQVLVAEELGRAGIDLEHGDAVISALNTVLTAPLGGPLKDLKLSDLDIGRRLHELSFDLPVAQQGDPVRSAGLAHAFEADNDHRFGKNYAQSLRQLDICSRGFLTGSIDLVFTDGDDPATARWWVADWKSNWIGERDDSGRGIACGPRHYSQAAMEEQMLSHHYPLQAHLYLLALDRYLRWRLDGYNPDRHLGGYAYVFLRGISPEGGSGVVIEPAPLTRIRRLDQWLEGLSS